MMQNALLTPHALMAMRRRGIDEVVVRAVLAAPMAVLSSNRPGRRVVQGRVSIGEPPRDVLLRIVLDADVTPPRVVTAYATTQFRKYGAEP